MSSHEQQETQFVVCELYATCGRQLASASSQGLNTQGCLTGHGGLWPQTRAGVCPRGGLWDAFWDWRGFHTHCGAGQLHRLGTPDLIPSAGWPFLPLQAEGC